MAGLVAGLGTGLVVMALVLVGKWFSWWPSRPTTSTSTNVLVAFFVIVAGFGFGFCLVTQSSQAQSPVGFAFLSGAAHVELDAHTHTREHSSDKRSGICSLFRTYGTLGGRGVMNDSQVHSKWSERETGIQMHLSAAACANNDACYPAMVKVTGVDAVVEPGVHSFTITSQFMRDEFHVALEGPELSPTFIEAHGNGTFTASYCVELPGFYKLYIRILQINKFVALRKDVFQSPFSVHVQGKAELQTITLDSCTRVGQATQGRWVRFDHAVSSNLVPSFELQQWGEFLEISRDEYVWLPYSCRLRPMNLEELRTLFQNRRHCACCDSYIRTLFSGTLWALGIFNDSQMEQTSKTRQSDGTYSPGKLIHHNWEIEGVSMSWNDIKDFERCLLKRPDGLVVESILLEPPAKLAGRLLRAVNHSATVGNSSGKFAFFVGHPWSGDHRIAHRSNYDIQRAQRATFNDLGLGIDIFDAFAFSWPRIYHEACDGSHVACAISDRLTLLGVWEMLILAQIL